MNSTDKLLIEMKGWLMLSPSNDTITIADCFRLASDDSDEWKVKLFYATFAPHMANILDDLNEKDKQ